MIIHNDITIDRVRMVIHRGDRRFKFSKYARRRMFPIICHLLLSGGISKDQLIEVMWGHREDGGPLYATNMIAVFFYQYRRVYKALGMRLHRDRRASVSYYSLVPDVV